jgi:hypothetical protein
MMRVLDFSLLEDESSTPDYADELISRLDPMPETVARARSAAMFALQAEKQAEPWLAAAFIRAALAELCSMEEMQSVDRPGAMQLKIADQRNPLLHLLVLLRHLNIHVKATGVTSQHSSILLDGLPICLNGQPLMWSVLVVTELLSSDLAALNNGRHYSGTDLDQCVAWFEGRQNSCGVGKLIAQGVAVFAMQLCGQHGL